MSKSLHTAQQYWDERSELFGNYYKQPTAFDKIFRQGVYTREAVANKVCQEYKKPIILDIGSGPGFNSVSFLKNSSASNLIGIDFSNNMVEYARDLVKKELVDDRCEYIEDDFMTYDWSNSSNSSFDITIALGVLDYIENASEFINKMDKLTSKVSVVSWPENGLRMALRKYRYTCPVFHYSKQDITDLYSDCKLTNLKFVKSRGGWVTIAYK